MSSSSTGVPPAATALAATALAATANAAAPNAVSGHDCYLSASNAQAWEAVYQSVDADTRGQVAAVVSDHATQLVDAFYSTLLADAEAGPRLSHEIVSTRLHRGMMH